MLPHNDVEITGWSSVKTVAELKTKSRDVTQAENEVTGERVSLSLARTKSEEFGDTASNVIVREF